MCGPLTSKRFYARMAELEDAYELESYVYRRVGSSPTLGTIIPETIKSFLGEEARTHLRGLIHGFTLSTTTDSNNRRIIFQVLDMRYVACGKRPLKNK